MYRRVVPIQHFVTTTTAVITESFSPVSRAVTRPVDPGNDANCAHCGEPVKFAARHQRRQVIANVYLDSRWDRVEHFHEDCYEAAGSPYGEPGDQLVAPPRRRPG
jgi:hypothetical protein